MVSKFLIDFVATIDRFAGQLWRSRTSEGGAEKKASCEDRGMLFGTPTGWYSAELELYVL